MKKVLIVNPYWDTLGGGERYLSSFARLLLARHWQVDILWTDDLTVSIRNHFNIELTGANWLNTVFSPQLSFGYDLLFYVSDGSLPVSFSSKTIIHLQFPFMGVHGRSFPNILKSRFYTFVVNSKFTKSFIDREFGVSSVVIYPPVDVSSFQPGKKSNHILYVGRFSNLTQSKGHGALLEAFSHISKSIPGWRLVLAGGTKVGLDNHYMQELTAKSAHLPVDIVTDPGFPDIRNLYAKSRLFWSASGYGIDEQKCPTKVEHFGISVVESMSAGCVPMLSDLGGHKEIIDNGQNGFLWHSLSDLEQKTLQLINSSDWEHLSLAAREKSKIFSILNFNSAFEKLLNI